MAVMALEGEVCGDAAPSAHEDDLKLTPDEELDSEARFEDELYSEEPDGGPPPSEAAGGPMRISDVMKRAQCSRTRA